MGGDGGDSDDGGYGIPSQTAQHCHRHRLFPQPQAAGSRAQALHKGSPEGKSGTLPCLQGVVCYTLQKRAEKTGTVFFSRRGGFTSRKRREKPTPARSVCGVFSRRVAGRTSKKHCYRRHACHPKGKTAGFHSAVSSVTDAGGIPTSLSLLSSLSPACFVSAISLPSFFLRYA